MYSYKLTTLITLAEWTLVKALHVVLKKGNPEIKIKYFFKNQQNVTPWCASMMCACTCAYTHRDIHKYIYICILFPWTRASHVQNSILGSMPTAIYKTFLFGIKGKISIICSNSADHWMGEWEIINTSTQPKYDW